MTLIWMMTRTKLKFSEREQRTRQLNQRWPKRPPHNRFVSTVLRDVKGQCGIGGPFLTHCLFDEKRSND
ncbi:MAG TPA: hypothetical protein DEF45_25560 [Rhodopirellula sp.]|nr:MAG: hypothetical protein CBD74_03865 [Saprospirales bacterium TMED214]HBV66384.1 hypothetical protein [Rhodopirellula sp.]